ncbi:MAG: hypothetical protein CSA58_02065 [Micrococcales bacterium]|nr:MAG: hypothetical protein CSB46_06375 [Micrococcales bacterium]PIE27846.1 MAG: hypothetical protein CSA58_02065 [Micrococcales bacterium]
MSIVGLVLAVIMAPVGLVVSYLAHRKSKQAGFSNTLAKVGMAVGGILSTVFLIVAIVVSVTLYNVWQTCQELGPGVHQRGDVIYTCN